MQQQEMSEEQSNVLNAIAAGLRVDPRYRRQVKKLRKQGLLKLNTKYVLTAEGLEVLKRQSPWTFR